MGIGAYRFDIQQLPFLSKVQNRLLGLLFGQPDRRFQGSELIRLVGSGTGAVHRQLKRMEAAGLLSVTDLGNQKYYAANPEAPIYPELCAIAAKTVGLAEPIRSALAPFRSHISMAFLYGSMAAGTDRGGSDVDLFVVSDAVEYADLYAALEPAERVLGRPVNPTLMSLTDWRRKRREPDSFVSRISGRPRLFLIGTDDELA